MKAKQNKYIDLNQFVYGKDGRISWKDCVGLTVEFFYNGNRHEINILERINKDYFKIMLDGIIIEKAHTSKIVKLMFDNLLYEPDYFYNVGDIINERLEVVEQIQIQRKTTKGNGFVKRKGYLCHCLIDSYNFEIEEFDLDLNLLLITDIVNSNSQAIVLGNKANITEKAYGVTLVNNTALLKGVVSRKKQVIPVLTENI